MSQVADIFMKPLTHENFERFRYELGMRGDLGRRYAGSTRYTGESYQ